MRTSCLSILGILSLCPGTPASEVNYQKDVKPILVARCFSCHGAVRQKGGLRLDAFQLIHKGGKNGAVIVPGKSDASLLIDAVLGKDRSRMPPEKEGEALPAQQIQLLRAWIDQGAKGADEAIPEDPRRHWAYQPVRKPVIPGGRNPQAVLRNPIDAFLEAERSTRGLVVNPPADRATLLRRVHLDLVGLPPTRQQIEEFLADPSPDAYEKVVDRLLASPHHGERWGRHWMDVWRYCDPFGFGQELRYSQMHIWHWRDWIIESLNADRGYDRMIQEMLAGDELAPSQQETLRATGYLARNWYKFNRNAWLQDTVEHTAAGFLGITMRCARCHDHKYDPISQQDYYRFRAFFEPHDVRIDPVPGQPDTKKDGIPRAFDARLDAPTHLFLRGDDRYPDKSRALTPGVPAILGSEELTIEPVHFSPRPGSSVADPATLAARAEVEAAEKALVAARAAVPEARRRLEEFTRGPMTPVTRSAPLFQDTFAKGLDSWKVIRGQWAIEKGQLTQKTPAVPWAMIVLQKPVPRDFLARVRYRTTGGNNYRSVGLAHDVIGDRSFQAVYTSVRGQTIQAFHRENGVELYPPAGIVPSPLKLNEEVTVDIAVRGEQLNAWMNGQMRIAYRLPLVRREGAFALWTLDATVEVIEVRLEELPASVSVTAAVTPNRRSPLEGPLQLTRADLEGAIKEAESAIPRAEARLAAAKTALQTAEARALKTVASTGRRLALARWMTRPDHPLTARVAVNHVWLRHFGQPLVPSVANFGLAGKKPSHPALLDWLAWRFVEDGWSFKKLHRLIVTSEAYRLSSGIPAGSRNASLDADNIYLWRMNSRRMESEVVRDSLLAISGQLDRSLGGPVIDEKLGLVESRRRSVYFKLTTEHRMLFMELFDLASPNECYERRESVIPQQALALSNSVLALNQARLLARSLQAAGESDFVRAAFAQVLNRAPSPAEQARCEKFLRDQAELLKLPGKLTPFPADGGAAVAPSPDPQMRARENLVHVLFNHNDFVTIR